MFKWHLSALLVACIWGSTFVSSKVLLNAGLTPADIMCLRFALAWLIMLFWGNIRFTRDEGWFVLLGLSGGSIYFLAENTAVQLTSYTSTVALLVSTTPIISALMNRLVHPNEKLSMRFLCGSLVALAGVSLVVFNGVFVLDDDPLVIFLSIGAALMWGIYSLVLRKTEGRYTTFYITRKVFFWGVITMLPVCLFETNQVSLDTLLTPAVLGNLLFLAVIASLGCFLLWNIAIHKIGIIASNNYLYFPPVTTLIVAHWVLGEHITWLAIIGCILTILGVWFAQKKDAIYN